MLLLPSYVLSEETDDSTTCCSSELYTFPKEEFHEHHPQYPFYLKKASDKPLRFPPRSEWIPLHRTSSTFFERLKRNVLKPFQKSKISNGTSVHKPLHSAPHQQQKTSWNIPALDDCPLSSPSLLSFKLSKPKLSNLREIEATRFSFIKQKDLDSPSINDDDSQPTLIIHSKNYKSVKFSNTYLRDQDANWIFVHKEANGKILGLYQIESRFI